MRKLSLLSLPSLFAAIDERMPLYLPVRSDGRVEFTRWMGGQDIAFTGNTDRSAKDFFFPQSEELMRLRREGKRVEVLDTRREAEDFVLFGVRPCDVKSFDILDSVFLAGPVDSYYATRREHGVVVSLACHLPSSTCFCGAFGIDAADPAGDVAAWLDGDTLYLRANTEKGERWLAAYDTLTEPSDENAIADLQQQIRDKVSTLPLAKLNTAAFGGDKLATFFDLPDWESLSVACLGCGTCTFVCPTCQCYDIVDFDTGHGIQRLRCWDSCMYSDFTKMAHGNPRTTQRERFRQRFMHKLVYYPAEHEGVFGCVGCGRCLRKCPQALHIAKVMSTLGKED